MEEDETGGCGLNTNRMLLSDFVCVDTVGRIESSTETRMDKRERNAILQ